MLLTDCNLRLQNAASPIIGIQEQFEFAMKEVVQNPDRRACMMAAASLELAQRDPEVRRRVSTYLRAMEELLFDALERARASGELSTSRSPRALARFLITTLHGVGIMSRGGASRQTISDSVGVALSVLEA